ncbi:hypothetical protein LOD99_12675 [Oopsacas minuta]|uniref:Uncharacterized protein n=1 Tax=Oopsacas minuta TaxID=111878 RepID=A0AAV7JCS2_9METZ|nr:hypothetical protein LOD99_12675 [Oopsacas minuta]
MNKYYSYFITLVLSVLLTLTICADECIKISDCACSTAKNGEVDLAGLAGEQGYLEADNDPKYKFRFYPCEIKQDWNDKCTIQDGPALCQYLFSSKETFNLGKVETMRVESHSGLVTVFNYTQGTPDEKGNRTSEIELVCNPNVTETVFEFVEERPIIHYKFRLTSNRVCPGLIDLGCQRIDSCTCQADYNKGFVSVHGLLNSLKKEWIEFEDNEAFYSLLPCPIKANSTAYKYCDDITGGPAACMKASDLERLTLGLQSKMRFVVTQKEPFTTAVVYYGGTSILNTERKATLVLRCDEDVSIAKVEYLGRNPLLNYNFRITSKDMCPHW